MRYLNCFAIIVTLFFGGVTYGQIVVSETFPQTNLASSIWDTNQVWSHGFRIVTNAVNEPSGSFSLNMDDRGDVLRSVAFDLSTNIPAVLSFSLEKGGNGVAPSTSSWFNIRYLNSSMVWTLLWKTNGDGSNETSFKEIHLDLPPQAMHAGFRLMITNSGTLLFGDYYMDDISITLVDPAAISSDLSLSINSRENDLAVEGQTISWLSGGIGTNSLDLYYDDDNTGTNGILIVSNLSVVPGSGTYTWDISLKPEDNYYVYGLLRSTSNQVVAYAQYPVVKTRRGYFPFQECFTSNVLDSSRWTLQSNMTVGVTVVTDASREPSGPYSLLLDKGSDSLTSLVLDTSLFDSVRIAFKLEKGGLGTVSNMIKVQYRNNNLEWRACYSNVGNAVAESDFSTVDLILPSDAMHAGFALQFMGRGGGGAGIGDFFIDDVNIVEMPRVSIDMDGRSYLLLHNRISLSAGDQVTLKAGKKIEVLILDMAGKKISGTDLDPGEDLLWPGQVKPAPGVYRLLLRTDGALQYRSEKILVLK